MWVKFLSRNYTSFQNLHQIPILSSIYWGLQFVCLYLVSLFDFISAKKLRHANYNKIPARSTGHVSRERAVLDLIALRKHDTQRLLLICAKKKSVSNVYVIGMPWMSRQSQFFFLTMQFYLPPAPTHLCIKYDDKPRLGTSRKIGWGLAAPFLNSLPYFRPKSVIFPTLFHIWSKIWYPISDLKPWPPVRDRSAWQAVTARTRLAYWH